MAGIAAFGGYVPRYRLGPETSGWNSPQERAVANFDEDSVTMAVAAGLDCLNGQDRQAVDGLIFATTTPPYAEKQCAAIIAAALDLRRDIFSADVTGVLRAGTTGLKSALDSVAAGPPTTCWSSLATTGSARPEETSSATWATERRRCWCPGTG